MTVLSKQDILSLIERQPPLVESCLNLNEQVQTNGIDLTLREVAMLQTPGVIGVENSQRRLSELSRLVFDGLEQIELMPGAYIITYNEIVNLPRDMMALGKPRSSLLRCGVTVHTAVWDAGYSGRSQSLMVVYNSRGIRLQKNARIMQLIFFRLDHETDGYRGRYLNENK